MRRKWNRSLGLLSSYYCSAFYNFPNLVEDLESSLLESQSCDFFFALLMAAEKILLQTDRRLDIILLAIIHGFLLSNMLSAQKTVRRSPFFALSPDAWCLASLLLHCILYKKRGRLRRLFL